MQKAHVYEAILLVNGEFEDEVRGLERLSGIKDSEPNSAYYDEKLTLFKVHPALPNGCCCSHVEGGERRNEARSGEKYREHEKCMLDQVQAHQEVLAVEESRHWERKAPRVRFLGSEERQAWERQYRKPPIDVGSQTQHRKGELR